MSTPRFAPPTAELHPGPRREGWPLFFPVGVGKFVLMWFCTLGWYQVYWFYMNWVIVRRRERSSISPAARTVLMPLFVYALFRRMRDERTKAGLPGALPAAAFAAVVVVLDLLVLARSPLSAAWLFLSLLVLVPVQSRVRELHRRLDPPPPANERLTAWNWLAVVPGVVFWLLLFIGLAARA